MSHHDFTSRSVRALGEALELQQAVAERLRVDDLGAPSRCEGWTTRQVLNHSIGVTRKFTDFASGASDEPHTRPGDLVGPDHNVALREVVADARTAWSSTDMRRTCRLAFGTFPAAVAAGINLFDVLAHTWDVAAAAGIDLDEDSEVWTVGLEAARAVIGGARDPLHYAPEVPVAAAATAMTRFLAFLGRTTAE